MAAQLPAPIPIVPTICKLRGASVDPAVMTTPGILIEPGTATPEDDGTSSRPHTTVEEGLDPESVTIWGLPVVPFAPPRTVAVSETVPIHVRPAGMVITVPVELRKLERMFPVDGGPNAPATMLFQSPGT